jgi:DNA transformation protein
MKKIDSFHEFVMGDLLAEVSGVTSKKMFSGYGIYKQGIIFAIIADGELYFKIGEENKADYEAYGSKPFTYKMPGGKLYKMSYWELPEEIMEDHEALRGWVEKAVQASVKAHRTKKKKK